MKQPVNVEITETAFQTLRQLKAYMSLFITPDQLNLLMTSLVQQTQQLIEEVPCRPTCPELSLIGNCLLIPSSKGTQLQIYHTT